MTPSEWLMAAIAGLVLSALVASGITWLTGAPVSLGRPLVSRDRILRSFLLCMFAGPVALLNEVRAARPDDVRAGLVAMAAAVLWASCLGVMTLTLVSAALDVVKSA